ncbi:MAG: radical SAM protein [Candidatus Omnitrophica bacterium]|nr:radical SAM protein [Candidatus Omnitrophota bacterium]
MKYIYGPIKSRRLGLSLGVSLTPYKICDFDCIYCQLGRANVISSERKEYVNKAQVLDELRVWLQSNPEEAKSLEFITFSGAGEPTLNTKIGEIIDEIKRTLPYRVCVITNASLLGDKEVRNSLLNADLIVPSLDAVSSEAFKRIDRPTQGIEIENIIDGLINLRKEFRGKIWLEIMLVRGVNDDLRHIKKMKEVIDRINPDKIQLNSPVRSTAENHVLSVGKYKLIKIKKIFGDKCEVI